MSSGVPGGRRGWFRRACAAGAWACALVWLIGLAFGDRWRWSQFVSWVPAIVCVIGAAGCWLAGMPWKTTGRAKWTIPACVMVMLLHTLFVRWRLHAARSEPYPSERARGTRLVAWNPGWDPMSAFDLRLLEVAPDVVFVTTPHWTSDFAKLREGMGDRTWSGRGGNIAFVSRLPVVRWGATALRVRQETSRLVWPPVTEFSSRGGEAMFVEFAGGPTGSLVVWVVDLPSDPYIHRRRMVGEMMASIRGFRGPVFRRDGEKDEVETPPDGTAGFPEPDVIVGDFNTPRGSTAFDLLPPGLTDAYEQGGWGPCGTFPRAFPLAQIDHAFVGPGLRASWYDAVDLGAGRHRAQVVDLEASR